MDGENLEDGYRGMGGDPNQRKRISCVDIVLNL